MSAPYGFDDPIGHVMPTEPPDAKPCDDCPAGCMYLDMVNALRLQPAEVQDANLSRWFCHAEPWRRCRGARDGVLA